MQDFGLTSEAYAAETAWSVAFRLSLLRVSHLWGGLPEKIVVASEQEELTDGREKHEGIEFR